MRLIGKTGIEWGKYVNSTTGEVNYMYYFYWWNRLYGKTRYIGPYYTYYDGPIGSFGFWFFNWSWSTPWTKCDF